MRNFVAMLIRTWGLMGKWLALSFLVGAAPALAQDGQFVLVDTTFTATVQNTSSSEYAVAPLPGAPDNWRTPIDYASGSLHVRVEVLEKPSMRATLCNVCLKANDRLTCMPYPKPYTAPGVYESDPQIPKFWQYNVYDWTMMVERVNVVVKDENGRFVQGNPAFFPTKLHVTVTAVAAGKKYVAPVSMNSDDADAGVGGGRQRVQMMLPGQTVSMTERVGSAGVSGGGIGLVATPEAGNPALSSRADAVSAPVVAGMSRDIRDYIEPGSACAVVCVRPKARYGASVSVVLGALALWQVTRLRRRTRRQKCGVRSHGRRI